MRLENAFEVPASPNAAWALLMDVPRIIPCMPGAELAEVVDESNWKANMKVKLGPISLQFATDVKREEADEAARRATLSANAREVRGKGGGQARIESTLTPLDSGTRIDIVTDLALSGPVAQYGRGMVQSVSEQLIGSFADCLRKQLADSPEEAHAAVEAQAKPVGGVSLGLKALGRSLAARVRRLLGRT